VYRALIDNTRVTAKSSKSGGTADIVLFALNDIWGGQFFIFRDCTKVHSIYIKDLGTRRKILRWKRRN